MEQVERYNQIIDDCYWNHLRHIRKESIQPLLDLGWCVEPNYPAKEDFINKCKTDLDFSQKWGLKIEEIELSLRERFRLIGYSEKFYFIVEKAIQEQGEEFLKMKLNEAKIPTKVITLTYNNEKIEIYE